MLSFQQEWQQGDRDKAIELAREYIHANADRLAPVLEAYSREQLVGEVDALRAEKRLADLIVVEMWLLTKFAPQQITGEAHVTVKLPQLAISASLLERLP